MTWKVIDTHADVLAVHAVLLHNGKILYFSGDEHDRNQHYHTPPDIYHTRFFNCADFSVIDTGCSPPFDSFCCGHSVLADGSVLIAGGTQNFDLQPGRHHMHFTGLRDSAVYNPRTDRWSRRADFNPEPTLQTGGGRWYPTLLTLGDGSVLALGGHPGIDDTRHNNNSPERFTVDPKPTGKWSFVTGPDEAHEFVDHYPRAHVLHDGTVFLASPANVDKINYRLDPFNGAYTPVCAAPADSLYSAYFSSSVMLPLRPGSYDKPRFLVCGGVTPMLLDIAAPNPHWTPTGPRSLDPPLPRWFLNAVLTPLGEVFVTGGVASESETDDSGVLETEQYDPENDTWSVLPPASRVRNYHSVAMLMPDGRIWAAGSNADARESFDPDRPQPAWLPDGWGNRDLYIEIYTPDYFDKHRPDIFYHDKRVRYGNPRLTLRTTDVDSIDQVAILRVGATTHSFNVDQRYIELDFDRGSTKGELVAHIPDSCNIAVPGYYLVFVITKDRVPSVGRFVRVGP